MIQLYNSFSKTIEPFTPLTAKKVRMYVCGVTPYDTTHLGHAFTYVFFDVLRRFLVYSGYDVAYTQNVTDIDDDILKRAKRDGRDWQELGKFWTDKYLSDMQALSVLQPTYYEKATDAIPEIIEMVKILREKNHAYVVDGTVFFSGQSFSSYGELSHYSTDEMIALSRERGANPEDPRKKDPLDFILWQKSLKGEPSWNSPWGKGRPGWHIECSSMIEKTLGSQIDIHGGGFDLIYPHHESERAQSESATGKSPFVSTWMHVAMVAYEGEKMSKSLGNLVLVSDLLKTYKPQVIRYLLLRHHYRSPWEFQENMLEEAKDALSAIEAGLLLQSSPDKEASELSVKETFLGALEQDMDTPLAIEIVSTFAKDLKKEAETKNITKQQEEIRELLGILGIDIPRT